MRSRKLLEIREEIIKILRDFKKKYHVKIYLFGSYAENRHTLHSDVDIVVVSDLFNGMDYPSRIEFIRLKLPYNLGFDIIALTPDEFEEKLKRPFFKTISKTWIEI